MFILRTYCWFLGTDDISFLNIISKKSIGFVGKMYPFDLEQVKYVYIDFTPYLKFDPSLNMRWHEADW